MRCASACSCRSGRLRSQIEKGAAYAAGHGYEGGRKDFGRKPVHIFERRTGRIYAAAARGAADGIIEQNLACNRVVFDLSGVRFMDSAGIGFLIGRYKKLKRSSTPAYIQSPDPAADKILSMSGIYSLIPKL